MARLAPSSRCPFKTFFAVCSCATAFLIAEGGVLADEVVVLPFDGSGGISAAAAQAHAEESKRALSDALVRRGHTLPTSSEMVMVEVVTRSGTGTSHERCQAVGKVSGAQWVALGHVVDGGPTYRLELEICLVRTGRVESVVREIQPGRVLDQVEEMLVFLLQPGGIGHRDVPWAATEASTDFSAATASRRPEGEGSQASATPPVVPASPPASPPTSPITPHFDVHGDKAFFGGLEGKTALLRPESARGSGTSLGIQGALTYAIPRVRGLDLRASMGFSVVGPSAGWGEMGARFFWQPWSRWSVFVGPEAGLGGFLTLGADKALRPLLRGGGVVAVSLPSSLQVEGATSVSISPGGSGTLTLGSLELRVGKRF